MEYIFPLWAAVSTNNDPPLPFMIDTKPKADTAPAANPAATEGARASEEFVTYRYRIYILLMFCGLEAVNAMLWVTFAPISDITGNYFGGGKYGSPTAVNMLANVFLILFLPGTILGVWLIKSAGFRNALLIGGGVTLLGAFLRYVATLSAGSLDDASLYWLILLGQILAAIVQPMFLNSPALVSSIWFPVKERDIATTIAACASGLGNAIGTLVPSLMVTQHAKSKGDFDSTVFLLC